MTYIIGIRCDICGYEATVPYEGQNHGEPEGWGTFTMHYPKDGPNHQMRHACPICTRALYEGRTPRETWMGNTVRTDRSGIVLCAQGARE